MFSLKDLSQTSAAFVSCSTYSGLAQTDVQFEYKRSSDLNTDATEDENDNESVSSKVSRSTCLLQQRSVMLKSSKTEPSTIDTIIHKEEQIALEVPTKKEDTTTDRQTAGDEVPNREIKPKTRTPVRMNRKKRTPKQSFQFLKRMCKNKSQNVFVGEYKNMSLFLAKLIKKQRNAPIKNKKDRIRRKNLMNRIRSLFKVLRNKLKKRDRLQRILLRKRMYRERQKRVHLRLKNILRVVYFKRQQRIRNMRDLRIRERKQLADTLMLQAAKLRARANRLTGGREAKVMYRKLSKISKQSELSKEIIVQKETFVGDHPDEQKPQIRIKISDQYPEPTITKHKKHRRKSHKHRQSDKHARKTKALDCKLKNLNERMKNLLEKLSTYSKPKKHSSSKFSSTIPYRITSGQDIFPQKIKKSSTKKRSIGRRRRKLRQAWWRRDRLKSAKIIKEKPLLDGFGSDTDVYDTAIESSDKTSFCKHHKQISPKRF